MKRADLARARARQRHLLLRQAESALERGDRDGALAKLAEAVKLKRAELPDKESADGARVAEGLLWMKEVPRMSARKAARWVLALDHNELPKHLQNPGGRDPDERINALAQSIRRARRLQK